MSTNQPSDAQGAGASSRASTVGNDAGNFIKTGAAKIHGLGEVIRGNFNAFADSVVGTDSSRSRNVTEKGMDEVKTGQYHGTGAGVTPADTDAERVKREVQGEGHVGHGQSTSTTTTTTSGKDRVV